MLGLGKDDAQGPTPHPHCLWEQLGAAPPVPHPDILFSVGFSGLLGWSATTPRLIWSDPVDTGLDPILLLHPGGRILASGGESPRGPAISPGSRWGSTELAVHLGGQGGGALSSGQCTQVQEGGEASPHCTPVGLPALSTASQSALDSSLVVSARSEGLAVHKGPPTPGGVSEAGSVLIW